MAKRSDFAQKLLDDLRLRKQKMGMASSGQRSGQPSSTDAYGNSRWTFQDSGDATSSKFSMKSTPKVTKIWLSTGHHKTPYLEGASQDIIPVGRIRSKEHTIDLSMALALALSNGGKLQNIELYGNATVEISDGVHKLNTILKACSNGVNFSRGAIDIGRELLRGAMDLEESLRMLVSLQDAADYMVGSQGKHVRLLKGKEEDESPSNEVNQMKLTNRHRFSFDGPSRQRRPAHPEQKQIALSYPEKLETPRSNSQSLPNASLQFNTQRRSLSCGPGSKPEAQKHSNTSKISQSEECRSFSSKGNSSTSAKKKQLGPKAGPVCEKVRIPNVVAKLMGLEELPLSKAEAKNSEIKVTKPKQAKEMDKSTELDKEVRKKEADVMTYVTNQFLKTDKQDKVPHEKVVIPTKALNSLDAVHSEGKQERKAMNNPKNVNPSSNYSPKPQLQISQQIGMTNMEYSKETRVAKKEVAEATERIFEKQQLYKGKGKQMAYATEERVLQHNTSPGNSYCDDTVSKHEILQRKKDLGQQRNALVDKNMLQQHSEVHGIKSKQAAHGSARKIEHTVKNKLQSIIEKKKGLKSTTTLKSSHEMRTQKVSSGISTIIASKNSSKHVTETEHSQEHHKSSHQEKQNSGNRSCAYHEMDRRSENRSLEERRAQNTVRGNKAMPVVLAAAIKIPVQVPPAEKTDITNPMVDGNEKSKIPMEGRSRTPDAKDQNLNQQSPNQDDLQHRRQERTNGADTTVNAHEMNSEKSLPQKTDPASVSCSPDTDDCIKPRLTDQSIVAERNDSVTHPMQYNDATIAESAAQQFPETSLKEDMELQFTLKENKSEVQDESRQGSNWNSFRWQNQETYQAHGQVSLTKKEYALKKILINNQHFLNAAQALFRIKIPVGVLQASEKVCPDEESKIVLDCGYELMRRKGKREEVIFSMRLSSSPTKLTSLDALVKQLSGDLESLEFPSMIEGDDYDIAQRLQKMIDRDIQNRNPDINSMWDFGWNSMISANIEKYETTRDVERHVLNGLIEELARELVNLSI